MSCKPADIDVFYVVYKPDIELLQASLQALSEQQEEAGIRLRVYLWDNSLDPEAHSRITALMEAFEQAFATLAVTRSEGNLGFGRGNNRLLDISGSDWVLLMNQDAIAEPGSLQRLVESLEQLPSDVAALEMRQIPYEHPKYYDPASLETGWVSGAACLLRRAAMLEVGGFDEGFFMYAEDVDLSWRLRAQGWRLKYCPQAAVLHETYTAPGLEKPLQAVEGTFNNLLLRARFGSWKDIGLGLLGVCHQLVRPSTFAGRRWQFAKLIGRYAKALPGYRRNRKALLNPGTAFVPEFKGWNFSDHREGAFIAFDSARKRNVDNLPLVSIIVRTHKRPQLLRQALRSLACQTYPLLEVIVVEDGPPMARQLVEQEFAGKLKVSYLCTEQAQGRSVAGNLGLSVAQGEWLGFLDDDDLLFADHIEVLLRQAWIAEVKGVYGLAWEVPTSILSMEPLAYEQKPPLLRYRQAFSRLLLWHHNYLPIQAVLFHRSLYEQHGGFAEDMDQLEDWDLWVRYSLNDDFLLVEKTTSLYRVPANRDESVSRLARLDEAYQQARKRQDVLTLTMSPRQFIDAAEEYRQGMAATLQRHARLRHWLERLRLLGLARWFRTHMLRWR